MNLLESINLNSGAGAGAGVSGSAGVNNTKSSTTTTSTPTKSTFIAKLNSGQTTTTTTTPLTLGTIAASTITNAIQSLNLKNFRYLLFIITISTLIFLYYANYSFYVKNTVFQIYKRINSINNNEIEHLIESTSIGNKSDIIVPSLLLSTSSPSLSLSTSSSPQSSKHSLQDDQVKVDDKTDSFSKNESKIDVNEMHYCPLIPPNLNTRINLLLESKPEQEIEQDFESRHLNISLGGKWEPISCKSRHKVAIIVPYRDREHNLELFLMNMHPFLIKQQLDYGIYLVEPMANLTFNRGLLMNIGFVESLKDSQTKWECFAFHDVDLLPEDERNIYSCPELPRHMSAAVSTLKYRLPYDAIFGGVTEFKKEHFEKVNGFSNLFFGWGGEDDDLRERVVKTGFNIARYPLEIGRYYMAKHEKDKPNPERFKLLKTSKNRIKKDGLTSLKYQTISLVKRKLYTKLIVYYDQKEILNSFKQL